MHVGWKLDGDFFWPAGMLDPSSHPNYVGGSDAMVVLKDDARPHAGGELILRQSHPPALEIGGRCDAIPPHVDRVVTERPGNESRYPHIGAIVLGGLYGEARQRQFADVEIHAAESTEEDLLRRQIHEYGINAVDLDRAVHERTHAVIATDRDRQLEFWHRCHSVSCPAKRRPARTPTAQLWPLLSQARSRKGRYGDVSECR